VLDNYQDLPGSAILHELLNSGFGEIPDDVQVIVLSRGEPPTHFARYAANGQIGRINWQLLQLTEEEGRGIARLRLGRASSTHGNISSLLRRTQGWVAGLVLLMEQSSTATASTPQDPENNMSAVFDYFAAEVFQHTDPVVQDFLLYTALLPKITLTVAEKLTGNPEARKVLGNLMRRNFFTVRHTEGSYEYHPLFRSFLLSQAAERYPAERIQEIQQQCATALVAQGDVEAAVSLLLKARDWPALAPLVLAQAPSLMGQGRILTLSGWLQALPASIRETNPWVLYWLGVSQLMYNQEEARVYFEKAFHIFEQAAEADPLYLAWTGMIDSFLIELGNYQSMGRWLELYPTLRGTRKPPSVEIEAASLFSYVAGQNFIRPDDPAFAVYANRAETLFAQAAGRWIIQGASMILNYLWSKEFSKASQLLSILEPHANLRSTAVSVRILWCSLKSLHAYFTSSLEECIHLSSLGLAMAEEHGMHAYDEMLAGVYIMGESLLGHYESARQIADRYLPIVNHSGGKGGYFLSCAAYASFNDGNLTRALQEIDMALSFETIKRVPLAVGLIHCERVLVLTRQGRMEEALRLLEDARVPNSKVHSPMLQYCYAFTEATVRLWRGEHELTVKALEAAFRVASQDGRITLPACQPRDEASILCNMALDAGLYTDIATKLIRNCRLLAPQSQGVSDVWPFPIKIYTLGRFRVLLNDKPLAYNTKLQKKPLELLKAIIAFGGRSVSVEQLSESLWPDADADSAQRALFTTLHRLRKLLGHEEAIGIEAGKITLDTSTCWVDVWNLERVLRELDSIMAEPGRLAVDEPGVRVSRAIRLYQGPFFGDDSAPSALSARERIRQRCLRTFERLGNAFEQARRPEQAVECYLPGIEIEPLAEGLYRRLMNCYALLGRRAEALSTFDRCATALKAQLGVGPSSETLQLRAQVLQTG